MLGCKERLALSDPQEDLTERMVLPLLEAAGASHHKPGGLSGSRSSVRHKRCSWGERDALPAGRSQRPSVYNVGTIRPCTGQSKWARSEEERRAC
eukprot:4915296-Prymnesium_polylepis.1